MRRGRLIGVGVGPGDPQLLTLKAVQVLGGVPVVAYIAAAGRTSRACETARPHLRPGARELVAVMPMGADRDASGRAYRQLAIGITSEIEQGWDVAFLCEGDPLLYGSFAHLLDHLEQPVDCEVIPGITSMTAGAAALVRPIALRDQPLVVLPATLPAVELAVRLKDARAAVLLKVGRHLDKVREALGEAGLLADAVLIENATLPSQAVHRLASATLKEAPYFSLVLARRQP